MLSTILTALGSGTVVFLVMIYHYEIKQPAQPDILNRKRDLKYEWFDFIRANINRSFTSYHCHQCRELISFFDQRFRREVPPHIFNEWVQALWNYLDTKYKTLLKED